jgi:ribosome-binding protein aMBF1 (putative translation factor)
MAGEGNRQRRVTRIEGQARTCVTARCDILEFMAGRRPSISEELRRQIEQSGMSRYRIAKETRVAESTLSRFMAGRSGLSITAINNLCRLFSLRLVPDRR